MPRQLVVFDANVYRGTPPARFADTCVRARAAGVVGMASPWVMLELLQHLADPDDSFFGPCWCGLSRLREHTQMSGERRACIPFCEDASDALAYEWYGLRDRSASNLCAQIEPDVLKAIEEGDPHGNGLVDCAVYAKEIVTAAKSDHGLGLGLGLELLKTMRGDDEDPIPARARRKMAREHYGICGLDYAAETIARGIARRAGREIDRGQIASHVARTLEVARTAATFLDRELRQLADDQLDPAKPEHLNSLFDLQLCFFASPALRVDNQALLNDAPLLLVTKDRRIRNAAAAAGHEDLVLTLDAFEAWLSKIC